MRLYNKEGVFLRDVVISKKIAGNILFEQLLSFIYIFGDSSMVRSLSRRYGYTVKGPYSLSALHKRVKKYEADKI